ncbi:MAG: nitroreductase family protein, partial [Coprobacillus sp.]
MELQDVLETRRSIRKYKDAMVSEEDIQSILEAAILAPSWKNSQVTRYRVIKSKDMLESIKGTLPDFNYQNVKDAPILIIPTI